MYFHANIENQLKDIFENTTLSKNNVNNENELHDFFDGQIYKNLLKSEDGVSFKNGKAFSLILNTDGVSLCTKSKLTMWPFFLAINEISKEDRFLINNVVLAGQHIFLKIFNFLLNLFRFAGLSVGDEKPNFDVFLHPLVSQLKKLEYGVEMKINNSIHNTKFFVVACVFEKPTKAAVLNMKASNGFYGCTKCLQAGVTYKDKDNDNRKY